MIEGTPKVLVKVYPIFKATDHNIEFPHLLAMGTNPWGPPQTPLWSPAVPTPLTIYNGVTAIKKACLDKQAFFIGV